MVATAGDDVAVMEGLAPGERLLVGVCDGVVLLLVVAVEDAAAEADAAPLRDAVYEIAAEEEMASERRGEEEGVCEAHARLEADCDLIALFERSVVEDRVRRMEVEGRRVVVGE